MAEEAERKRTLYSLINISDPLGMKHLSPVALKILKMVKEGMGFVFSAKIAEKSAYAHIVQTQAEAVADASKAIIANRAQLIVQHEFELVKTIEGRAWLRSNQETLRQQKNLEDIAYHAINFAQESPSMLSAQLQETNDLDDDWFHEFKDFSKNTSNEKMREIWGKVLAYQIVDHEAFHVRDLLVLKTMSSGEAGIFQKFCQLIVQQDNETTGHIYTFNDHLFSDGEQFYGLTYDEVLTLQTLGLVTAVANYELDAEIKIGVPSQYSVAGKKLMVTRRREQADRLTPAIPLSPTGWRLSRLIQKNPPPEYLKQVVATFEQADCSVELT